MTAGTGRSLRSHPPSPPQSQDSDLASEASQGPSGLYHAMYGSEGAYGAAGQANDISFDSQSSLSITLQYGPTSDYSQNASLTSMEPNGLGPHTPPVSDDNGISDSVDSIAARWSPPSQRRILSRPSVARSPKQRRRTKRTRDRDGRTILPGPLSEITKHLTHVPIKDMDEFVHRSIEERRLEVAKKNGKVARPMNSFMLYRSAYADRTKAWFDQNNHQVVSEVTGDSWSHETPAIRQKYTRLASIEKQNHLLAHPGYKFTPAKDRRRRQGSDDSGFLGDHRNTPDLDSIGANSSRSTPFDTLDHGLPNDGYFPSSWPTSNPNRSLSGIMLSSGPSQYTQPTANPTLLGYNVEDVHARLGSVDADEIQYSSSTTLAGLPGAAHHDLIQPQTQQLTVSEHGQLDPQLLGFSGAPANLDGGSQLYGSSHYSMWQESPGQNSYVPVPTSMDPGAMPYAGASSFQPGMQSLGDGRGAWGPSQGNTFDAAGGEFDTFFNDSVGY
ncbi:HMG-box domain-containing protein [Aspergillus lucknowensis]|uniref:HMG box domain-containing protein n=1 Tax=Aspergillus lucknowensis TaxID=176173 RepID=A0ABR4LLT4_9EURO